MDTTALCVDRNWEAARVRVTFPTFPRRYPHSGPRSSYPPAFLYSSVASSFFFVSFRRRIFLFAAPHALRNFRRSRKRIDLLLLSSFFSLSYLVVLRADVVVHTPHHNLVIAPPPSRETTLSHPQRRRVSERRIPCDVCFPAILPRTSSSRFVVF